MGHRAGRRRRPQPVGLSRSSQGQANRSTKPLSQSSKATDESELREDGPAESAIAEPTAAELAAAESATAATAAGMAAPESATRKAPYLSALTMIGAVYHQSPSIKIQDELNVLTWQLLDDEISKAQVPAELLRVAGRAACKRALSTLKFQISFILYGDPLAEPEDYTVPNTDPNYPEAHLRHCMTADDLRNMDGGRAVAWVAPPPPREPRWQFPEQSAAERHLAAKELSRTLMRQQGYSEHQIRQAFYSGLCAF